MEAATKTHSTKTLADQFDLHTRLFNNVLDGITEDEADHRIGDNVNPMKWIAGHLTSMRYGLGQLAQLDEADPYHELFSHGQSFQELDDYPLMEKIKENWNRISDRLSAGLRQLPEEALASPAPANVPVPDKSLGGMLTFLMHHEAYHLGQLSLYRRLHGKPAMKYS